MPVKQLSNESTGDCPVGDCGKPAFPFGTESLAGYVDACADHATDCIEDALAEQRENPDTALAIQGFLSAEECRLFLEKVTAANLRLRGAHVADVVSIMSDQDFCLDLVEPAYEALKDQVKRPELIGPASIVVWYLNAPVSEEALPLLVPLVRALLERGR